MSAQKSAKVKTRMDVWSVMLILSLVAVSLACLLMWLELSRYGSLPQWKA